MGTARVARELRAMGVTQAESSEPITKGDLDAILRSVTVLGWRQNTSNNKPVGGPDKGVYPAIITPKEFEDVQIALRSRNKKDTPNGRHRHNLFEKRTYCASCGSPPVFAMPATVMRSHAAGKRRMGATHQTSATTKTSCWV